MKLKLLKIFTLLISFIFLTGFIPFLSLIGPSFTAITSGNIYKASAQFIIDQSIKKKTGKNSLSLVKHEIDKKNQQNKLNKELRQLVEKRIIMTRKKLNLNNINQ
tara:strand:- start:1311 stop:1625 length:315 start_codon:yes stop_codon:yes gene_type:complete